MAKQTVNTGTSENDRTGTKNRDAWDMVNDNFTEVYDDISGFATEFTSAKINTGELNYTDTYWNDLKVSAAIFEFAGNADPNPVSYNVGASGLSMLMYEFAKNDEVYFNIQVPHDIKIGSDLYCHIHWTPGTRGNEEAGKTVGWKVQFLLANIGTAFPATVYTVDLSDTCTGTDHLHEITPDTKVTLTEEINISAFILGKIYRSDTGTDDTWAGSTTNNLPLLLGMDFHYEIDAPGSREHLSK